jgi:alpha-2-macroglobulin-like protein
VGGASTSITQSSGDSLLIETTSIAVLVWLHDDSLFVRNTEAAIQWLTTRCKEGRFGSTQATVLALKVRPAGA